MKSKDVIYTDQKTIRLDLITKSEKSIESSLYRADKTALIADNASSMKQILYSLNRYFQIKDNEDQLLYVKSTNSNSQNKSKVQFHPIRK